MTDKKKLVKCYYLQVFDPPTRAPHLVAASIQAQGLANILQIGDGVGLPCHRDGIEHIPPSLSVFVVGIPLLVHRNILKNIFKILHFRDRILHIGCIITLGIVSCSNLLLNIIQLDIPSVGFVAREKCVALAEGTRKIRKFAFGNVSLLGGIIGGT